MQITMNKEKANEIKQRLYLRGETLKSWCQDNNFKYFTASNVLRGVNKANFGEGRDVLLKLTQLSNSDFTKGSV